MPAQLVKIHGSTTATGAPMTVNLTSPVPVGNTLVAVYASRGSTSQYTPAPTTGLETWQKFSTNSSNRSSHVGYAAALELVPSGTAVTVDIGGNSGTLYVMEFSGLANQTHTSSSTGSSTNSTGTVNYLAGDLVIGSTAIAGTDQPSPSAPYQSLVPVYINGGTKSTSYITGTGGYQIPSSSGASNYSYTGTAGSNVLVTLQAVENVNSDVPKNLTVTRSGETANLTWTAPLSQIDSYTVTRIEPYLTGDDREFTGGIGGWTVDTGALVSWSGSALRMESTGTGVARAQSKELVVTPGATYSCTAKFRNVSGSRGASPGLIFYDAAGATVDDLVNTSYFTGVKGTFSQLKTYTAQAPAGAVTVRGVLYYTNGTTLVGDVSEWDDVDFGLAKTISVPNTETSTVDSDAPSSGTLVYYVHSNYGTASSITSNPALLSAGPSAPGPVGHGQLVGIPL